MGDLSVVEHKMPLREEDFPVAVTGADKRQGAGLGIGHIGADVEKIFEKPEGAKSGAGGFATQEKIGSAGERDDEFEERAAKHHEGMAEASLRATAENAEEWMADFVNGQVGEVDEKETGAIEGGAEKEEERKRESEDGGGAGDGFPAVG